MTNADEHESITRVITQAIKDARETGIDSVGQIQQAVAVVLTVRPDLSEVEVRRLVKLVTIG
jgi:hypothetical protein